MSEIVESFKVESVFTSHEFIVRLMERYPELYVADLLAFYKKNTRRPVTTLHSLIAKGLAKMDGKSVRRLGRTSTRNILGRTTPNQEWLRQN